MFVNLYNNSKNVKVTLKEKNGDREVNDVVGIYIDVRNHKVSIKKRKGKRVSCETISCNKINGIVMSRDGVQREIGDLEHIEDRFV